MAITKVVSASPALQPVKMSKKDIAGSIFLREEAVHDNINGTPTTDVVTFTSEDAAFETGIFKSGPFYNEVKAPGLPSNELLYFVEGDLKLTSSDGSIMNVKAGEAVTLPRGWTGIYESEYGYAKIYITYNPDLIKQKPP